MIKKILLLISLSLAFIFLLQNTAMSADEKNYDESGIFFEHWLHYDSQGIPCQECHIKMTDRIYYLPKHKECEVCHPPGKQDDYSKTTGKTCNKCHPIGSSYKTPIISKIDRSKDRFFYHSEKLNNLCEICHGGMLEDSIELGKLLTSKNARVKIRRKAHRFHSVKKCQNCHKDFSPDKAPSNHEKDNWMKRHAEIAPQFKCRICHTDSFCKNCHEDVY